MTKDFVYSLKLNIFTSKLETFTKTIKKKNNKNNLFLLSYLLKNLIYGT